MGRKKTENQATILQVAAQAELSIATVSRVLNGGKYVSEQARQKVLRAAEELNYQPNYMARQLHGQEDFSIGVLLGLDLGTISPFALKVYEALKISLQESGYRAKRVKFDAQGQLQTRARAYISIGVHDSDARIKELEHTGTPVIHVGEPKPDSYWVASNDEQGGYLATRHLLDNGCRTIYYVCLDASHKVSQLRREGYRQAMLEAGLIPSEVIEVSSNTGLPALDSYRRVRSLLESGLRPDGFVAFSDIVAAGICTALTDTDRTVPDDVQVVGYDGIDNDRYDSLTSVCQDIEGIANQTTRLAIEAIRQSPTRGEYLNVLLKQGNTTQPAAV